MLFPRKLKYKKRQRSVINKINRIKSYIIYKKETPKIITTTSCLIKTKQIEAVRKILSRKLKHLNKFSICIFPDLPVTSKPLAMRMGKGKGNFKEWVTKIKAGTAIFKFKNTTKENLKKILISNFNKFPKPIKLI